MIGLVLVTHGRLAAEFRSALEHVVGPQKQIEAVTIGPTTTSSNAARTSSRRSSGWTAAKGSPSSPICSAARLNLAISVMGAAKVEVLARHQSSDAGELAKVRDECPLDRGGGGCAGLRPQIHHHRQRVLTGK